MDQITPKMVENVYKGGLAVVALIGFVESSMSSTMLFIIYGIAMAVMITAYVYSRSSKICALNFFWMLSSLCIIAASFVRIYLPVSFGVMAALTAVLIIAAVAFLLIPEWQRMKKQSK